MPLPEVKTINKPDALKILKTYSPKKYWKEFQKAGWTPPSSHYNSVNWENVDDGHLEVRWLGGTNYHKKWKEVKEALGRFASTLIIGLDPEYKKKEYISKVRIDTMFGKQSYYLIPSIF